MIVTGVTGATRESEFEPKATQRVTIRRENTEEKRRRNARKRKSEGGREEHKVKSKKKKQVLEWTVARPQQAPFLPF